MRVGEANPANKPAISALQLALTALLSHLAGKARGLG